MCGSMVDIQSPAAEIRREKKKKEETTGKNILSASATQGGHKNESKHSEMGPVRQNQIQRTVRSVHVCALHCAQLLHTILHTTDLIIFRLAIQTITIALTMSI